MSEAIRERPIPVYSEMAGGPEPTGYVMVHSDSFGRDPPWKRKRGYGVGESLSIRGMIPGFRTDDKLPKLPDDAYGLTHVKVREREDAADPPYFHRRTGEKRPDGIEVVLQFERANGTTRAEWLHISTHLAKTIRTEYNHPNSGRDKRYWYEYFQSMDAAVRHVRHHTGLDISEVVQDG